MSRDVDLRSTQQVPPAPRCLVVGLVCRHGEAMKEITIGSRERHQTVVAAGFFFGPYGSFSTGSHEGSNPSH